MSEIFELPIPFEILDQATERCLPGYTAKLADIERQQSPSGVVSYRLSQRQLGDIGEVTLYKKGQQLTELCIDGPPHPRTRLPSRQDLEPISTITDDEERIRAKARLVRKLSSESKELYQKRHAHHRLVIEAFINHLIDDYGHLYPIFTSEATLQVKKDHEEYREDIVRLISTHNRRIQKLKEQQAYCGKSVDPSISMEIEDTEATVRDLEMQIEQI